VILVMVAAMVMGTNAPSDGSNAHRALIPSDRGVNTTLPVSHARGPFLLRGSRVYDSQSGAEESAEVGVGLLPGPTRHPGGWATAYSAAQFGSTNTSNAVGNSESTYESDNHAGGSPS
jgi:hypothetical protein